MPDRMPMSPTEFDAAKRRFEQHFAGVVHQTSGTRSLIGNADAKGHEMSKHLYGMAADYILNVHSVIKHNAVMHFAVRLGFWIKRYDWGVHLQGLPTGPIPYWWWVKYGEGKAAEKLGMEHLGELVRSDAV